jgi:hypothetical protein
MQRAVAVTTIECIKRQGETTPAARRSFGEKTSNLMSTRPIPSRVRSVERGEQLVSFARRARHGSPDRSWLPANKVASLDEERAPQPARREQPCPDGTTHGVRMDALLGGSGRHVHECLGRRLASKLSDAPPPVRDRFAGSIELNPRRLEQVAGRGAITAIEARDVA